MLGFALSCVQLHPGAAVFWRVYFWVVPRKNSMREREVQVLTVTTRENF
jgi:hypothetical protein